MSFTLNHAKSYFFTARDWEKILAPAEKNALNRAGALYRKQMKWFLSRKRGRPSKPRRESPTRWGGLLWRHVYYAYDPVDNGVIVGPAYFPGPHKKVYTFPPKTIPALLEYGGRERVGYARVTSQGWHLEANTVVRIAPRPYVRRTIEHEKTRKLVLETFEDMLGRTPESLAIAAGLRPPSAAA